MLIWTTKGPKRAEISVTKQPVEDAFAESPAERDPKSKSDTDGRTESGTDVFLDRPVSEPPPAPAAVDDGDWSSAEAPRTKAPETAE